MISKKILLVNPLLQMKTAGLNIPMGLMCLGAYLDKRDYCVEILDANNVASPALFQQKLARALPDALCVGFTVMSAQIPYALEMSRWIKKEYPGLPVIWGGVHPTLYPVQTAACPYVDFVVKGEGESSLLELVAALSSGTADYSGIRGIAYRDKRNGTMVETDSRELLDLDTLPMINWHLLDDIARVGNLQAVEQLTLIGLPLITSRGCPHKCAFCINTVYRTGIRMRSAELVLEELSGLVQRGVQRINFLDEIFFFKKKRLLAILDGIEKQDLKFLWSGSVRCDYFKPDYLNLELLHRVKQSGCQFVGIGAESGSPRILDYLQKDITPAEILQTAYTLHKADIHANFSFMIGMPGESESDIRQSLDLIMKITAIDNYFKILGPQLYRPYPGSKLYQDCIKAGMKEPQSLEAWASSPYIRSEETAGNKAGSYPWLAYPLSRIKNIIFYAALLGRNSRFKWVTSFVRKGAALRCRTFFFCLPLEKWLYALFRIIGFNKWLQRKEKQ